MITINDWWSIFCCGVKWGSAGKGAGFFVTASAGVKRRGGAFFDHFHKYSSDTWNHRARLLSLLPVTGRCGIYVAGSCWGFVSVTHPDCRRMRPFCGEKALLEPLVRAVGLQEGRADTAGPLSASPRRRRSVSGCSRPRAPCVVRPKIRRFPAGRLKAAFRRIRTQTGRNDQELLLRFRLRLFWITSLPTHWPAWQRPPATTHRQHNKQYRLWILQGPSKVLNQAQSPESETKGQKWNAGGLVYIKDFLKYKDWCVCVCMLVCVPSVDSLPIDNSAAFSTIGWYHELISCTHTWI